MISSHLLEILKSNARQISIQDFAIAHQELFEDFKYVPEPYKSYWVKEMLKYLLLNLKELTNTCNVCPEDLDEKKFREFIKKINENSKFDAFKKISLVVLPYLAFIAKKPIHPPEMIFPGGKKIKKAENRYFCPVKNKQINPYSFCEFCVCEAYE
ncbi:MAG: DUF2115 family protein [Archaeoglobales archaeon]|nr:DUF2115 family protein [Archaeoglobales archaeon]